ncbi:MAG: NTP transferase domain-containing protein, partial [Actinomycetota bacterium]|nr:NTP transferase domain-containing protein [Actinomycetota bacterium]
PPGGGPVAGPAAALPLTRAGIVVVLAADLPLLGPTVPRLVAAAGSGDDGALLVDGEGRQQFLTAAYRRRSLLAALAAVADPGGASMRSVLADLRLRTVRDETGAAFDVDTAADVVRAEQLLREAEGGARGVDDDGGA